MLWPRAGFTKGDLIDYYLAVVPALLPHLAERPLTLGRWPQGVEGRGFAQTECRGRPDWMRTLPLGLQSGEVRNYCLVDDAASLAWVANLGTIELHTYQFTAARPDEPTLVTLDFDPGPGSGLVGACRAALLARGLLDRLGLMAFAKTSGGRGIHVYVPLGDPHPGERTREVARELARTLAAEHPELVTDDPRPAARPGRVLVDWLQSDPRRSTAAPYSLRATDVPGVSTPLDWAELEHAAAREDASMLRFHPAEVLRRLERRADLFRPVLELRQAPPAGRSARLR